MKVFRCKHFSETVYDSFEIAVLTSSFKVLKSKGCNLSFYKCQINCVKYFQQNWSKWKMVIKVFSLMPSSHFCRIILKDNYHSECRLVVLSELRGGNIYLNALRNVIHRGDLRSWARYSMAPVMALPWPNATNVQLLLLKTEFISNVWLFGIKIMWKTMNNILLHSLSAQL